jgi:hypothetical protein
MRRASLAVLATTALVLTSIGVATAALVSGDPISCTVSAVDGGQQIVCDVPDQPAVTTTATVTEPGPTVTATATVTETATPSPSPTPTPTPTPSPSPSPSPSPTATPTSSGAFPDASNTGVPAGATLVRIPQDRTSGPGWHYDSRGWVTVDGSGTTFSGYSVATNVDVTASNVTVSNNLIVSAGGWGISLRHTTGVKIDHNTLRGAGSATAQTCDNAVRGIYGDDDAVTITANNIYWCSSGINHLDRGGLIRDNYIHDIGHTCTSGDVNCGHFNGIQLGSGDGPLMVIDNNTILIPWPATDAVMLANDDGPQTNRRITNNLLAGGGYTFYGAGGPDGAATDIVFTGNQFSTRYYPQSGYWGPVAHWQASKAGNVWSNNTWADGPNAGKPVSP